MVMLARVTVLLPGAAVAQRSDLPRNALLFQTKPNAYYRAGSKCSVRGRCRHWTSSSTPTLRRRGIVPGHYPAGIAGQPHEDARDR